MKYQMRLADGCKVSMLKGGDTFILPKSGGNWRSDRVWMKTQGCPDHGDVQGSQIVSSQKDSADVHCFMVALEDGQWAAIHPDEPVKPVDVSGAEVHIRPVGDLVF
jgi:hypothetical protein